MGGACPQFSVVLSVIMYFMVPPRSSLQKKWKYVKIENTNMYSKITMIETTWTNDTEFEHGEPCLWSTMCQINPRLVYVRTVLRMFARVLDRRIYVSSGINSIPMHNRNRVPCFVTSTADQITTTNRDELRRPIWSNILNQRRKWAVRVLCFQ